MSEPRPIFVPTEEGVAAVLRAARRRRWRQSWSAATVIVALTGGGLAITATHGPAGTQRLSISQSTTATPSPPVVGGAGPGPKASAAAPSGQPARSSVQAPGTTGQAPSGQSRTNGERSAPLGAGWSPTAPYHRYSPIQHGSGTIAGTDLCSDDPWDASNGWCVRYLGPTTARRGVPVQLSGELCRLTAFGAASVQFRTTREVDLSVAYSKADGTVVKEWQAGDGVRFHKPGRTVTVLGGSCLVWSSTWDTRTERGALVRPGSYSVALSIDSTMPLFSGVGNTIQITG